jgi:ATP-dependent helicase STH1/SNF2
VRVYRLVTNKTVEEGILSKAQGKKHLDNKIIQAGLFNEKATDADRNNKLR